MVTKTVVLAPFSPNASPIRSSARNDGTPAGIGSTDCARTTVSNCGNNTASTTAVEAHAVTTSALCDKT